MTERIAFRMYLEPGAAEEYRRRHDEIWPELTTLLRNAGVADYSIFVDHETDTLFATLVRVTDHKMDELEANPVMLDWWRQLADITVSDSSKKPIIRDLKRVFYLE